MNEYKIIVPIDGAITLDVIAETIEDAVDVLLEKQETLEKHPNGKLNLKLNNVIIIPNESIIPN